MKRHFPAGDHVVAALAGRVDEVEERLASLEELRTDMAALGRRLADVSAQLRNLSAATTGHIIRSAGQGDGEPRGTDGGEEPAADGQPDWLTVTDPLTAAGWLTDVAAFSTDVLAPVDLAPAAGCWPLHPGVVVELLALQAEYRACYGGDNPTPVCELLARWLPGSHERITATLGPCTADRGHHHGGGLYDAAGLDPLHVARWWADTHGSDPDAVTAFALTRIT